MSICVALYTYRMDKTTAENEQLALAEIQVLLSQLRTQLSILRAGMGLVAGAISIAFILFTSNWLAQSEAFWLDMPIKAFLGVLVVVGLWRMLAAERKLRRINRLIHEMEKNNKLVDRIVF